MISRTNWFSIAGVVSRAQQTAILLAAFAILCSAAPAQTPAKADAHSGTHAAPASKPAIAAAPVKTIGDKNAPITLEIFSDYECPVCGWFFENTAREMMKTYVAEGKVYVVHHDFPLQRHRYAGQAARWANAAAKIGKFEDVEAALYDNQAKWTADGDIEKYVADAMSPADFKRVQAILKTCTTPPPTSLANSSLPQVDPGCSVDSYIVKDIALGYQVPITGTPTMVVHYKGKSYPANSGPVSWPILKQLFDSLLSQ